MDMVCRGASGPAAKSCRAAGSVSPARSVSAYPFSVMVKLASWRLGFWNTCTSRAQSGPAQSALYPPATLATTSLS